MRIWDIASGKEVGASGPGHARSLIWSDSGCGQECTLTGHSAAVNSVAYSPDGTRVVSASGDY